MPEIKGMAAHMAANADEDKKKQFMKGFNRALGGPHDEEKEDKKESGMIAAMKRAVIGG